MEMTKQMANLPRRRFLEEVVANRAYAVLVRDLAHAVQFVNGFAPEHLSIVTQDPWSIAKRIRNTGAIFLGPYSPVVAGDFIAGARSQTPTPGARKNVRGFKGGPIPTKKKVGSYKSADLHK